MANILILGGGFGGMIAAERLAEVLDPVHQITLVSPSRKFTFYPALIQLAFGVSELGDISFDLAVKMKEIGVRFVQGDAVKINGGVRAVTVAGEDFAGDIHYDYLVIAIGRHLAVQKVPGFFEYSNHLLGVNAALKFGQAIANFEAGDIILGMCPGARLPVPVCEAAFALAKKYDVEMREGKVHIKVIFPESLEAAFGGATLHKELEDAFNQHNINVIYEVPISEITPSEVLSSKKHRIKYDLLMMVPPFEGQQIVIGLGPDASDADGYALVNGKMQVHGLERTYAVGDIVAFSGPKLGHMAVRQARVAADNIIAEIKGEEPKEEYYHEINMVIDEGGSESIHLHYGIWDEKLMALQKGAFWTWAKNLHDRVWRVRHS